MVKKFLSLVIVLSCLILNSSNSSAERLVKYPYLTPSGSVFVDFDSIVVKKYKPPEYILSVTMATESAHYGVAYNVPNFYYNFDTKVISRVLMFGGNSVKERINDLDKKIAIDIWEHYYNMSFYSETNEQKAKKEALELNKKKTEEKFNLLVAQGDKFYAAKDYKSSITSYLNARDLDKNSIDKFFNELVKNGDKLSAQENYYAALDYYRKATIMCPWDNNCSRKLWDTYYETKNFDEAINYYQQMTMITPKISVYWFYLASSYNEIGKHNESIEAYTKAIELDPNDAATYNNRGIEYALLKKYELAIQDFDKAIKLRPNDSGTYYIRGVTYEKLKQYKKAMKDFKKALKLNPNDNNAKKAIERISKLK